MQDYIIINSSNCFNPIGRTEKDIKIKYAGERPNMQIDYSALDGADMAELLEKIAAELIKYERPMDTVTINDIYRYLKTKTSLLGRCGKEPEYIYYISSLEQPIYSEDEAFELLRRNEKSILFRSYHIDGRHYMELYDQNEDAWKFELNGRIYYA